jgi:hypothetical protein
MHIHATVLFPFFLDFANTHAPDFGRVGNMGTTARLQVSGVFTPTDTHKPDLVCTARWLDRHRFHKVRGCIQIGLGDPRG